jgi:hypothetical protein
MGRAKSCARLSRHQQARHLGADNERIRWPAGDATKLMPAKTPFPVQAEVLVQHLTGASKTEIAKDLGLGRNTVCRILDESEIEQLHMQSKSILLNALPDSAETIARAVRKSPAHAWELLDRTGVMPKTSGEAPSLNVAISTGRLPSLNGEESNQGSIRVNQPNGTANSSVSERGSA